VQRGFIRSLFDLSFTSFVTPRAVKVLYVLSFLPAVIVYAAVANMLFTSGMGDSVTLAADGSFQIDSGGDTGLGLAWLFVFGPLFLFLHALVGRVLSELVVALIRIYENTRDQLALTQRAGEAPPA
jgi:hypothetical protein